jgi:hypothetical protein
MLLDLLAEQESEDGGRQEGDDQVDDEFLLLRIVGQSAQHGADALAVLPDHGQYRAGLDGDLEHFDFFTGEVEQAAGQDQMPGRRNGQEFGETFDQAHDDGFNRENEVHVFIM